MLANKTKPNIQGNLNYRVIEDTHNRRIKLIGIEPHHFRERFAESLTQPIKEGTHKEFSKVIVMSPHSEPEAWKKLGLEREGCIKGFFADGRTAHVWSLFGKNRKENPAESLLHENVIDIAKSKEPAVPTLPTGYSCERADRTHAAEISKLLQQTFSEYPNPLNEKTIQSFIDKGSHHYRVIRDSSGEVAALASGEMDAKNKSAEMTDCATKKTERGKGLMAYLLYTIEKDLKRHFGITNLFTLARAREIGVNCAFKKLGYCFGGRLKKNSLMPTGYESMNVWYKDSALLDLRFDK